MARGDRAEHDRAHLALGAVTTVATAADGLDWASSLAFGQSGGEHKTLYAVNFAIGPPGGPGPSLFTLDAGIPGQPVP